MSRAAISASVMPGWMNLQISVKAASVISWAFTMRVNLKAQLAGIAASRAGVSGKDIDGAARKEGNFNYKMINSLGEWVMSVTPPSSIRTTSSMRTPNWPGI
mgnify:CR=1 FL=1